MYGRLKHTRSLTATHCNTLQHPATPYNTRGIQHIRFILYHTHNSQPHESLALSHCNTLQHTATQCNTLQHTATHCNTQQHTATHVVFSTLILFYITHTHTHTHTHTNHPRSLNHSRFLTATQCNTLQHTATH